MNKCIMKEGSVSGNEMFWNTTYNCRLEYVWFICGNYNSFQNNLELRIVKWKGEGTTPGALVSQCILSCSWRKVFMNEDLHHFQDNLQIVLRERRDDNQDTFLNMLANIVNTFTIVKVVIDNYDYKIYTYQPTLVIEPWPQRPRLYRFIQILPNLILLFTLSP